MPGKIAGDKGFIFLNGVMIGTKANGFASASYTGLNLTALDSGANRALQGYVDEVRITKAARYITTFTPP